MSLEGIVDGIADSLGREEVVDVVIDFKEKGVGHRLE